MTIVGINTMGSCDIIYIYPDDKGSKSLKWWNVIPYLLGRSPENTLLDLIFFGFQFLMFWNVYIHTPQNIYMWVHFPLCQFRTIMNHSDNISISSPKVAFPTCYFEHTTCSLQQLSTYRFWPSLHLLLVLWLHLRYQN